MISVACPSPIKFYTANIFLLAIQVDVCVCNNSYCFFFGNKHETLGKFCSWLFCSQLCLLFLVFFLEHVSWNTVTMLLSMEITWLIMHTSSGYYKYKQLVDITLCVDQKWLYQQCTNRSGTARLYYIIIVEHTQGLLYQCRYSTAVTHAIIPDERFYRHDAM